MSPNVAHGGQKTNVIPDVVDVEVDIRTVPGTQPRRRAGDARRRARRARHRHVEVSDLQNSDASICGTDNDAVVDDQPSTPRSPIPGASLVPGLIVGGTDARFYRDRGRVAYGAGLFSPGMDIATFGSRFHGHDERIDVDSLALGDRVLDRHRQRPRRADARRHSPTKARMWKCIWSGP